QPGAIAIRNSAHRNEHHSTRCSGHDFSVIRSWSPCPAGLPSRHGGDRGTKPGCKRLPLVVSTMALTVACTIPPPDSFTPRSHTVLAGRPPVPFFHSAYPATLKRA